MLALVGCVAPPQPAARPVFRDVARPIASKAEWQAERFAGAWRVVDWYPAAGCRPERIVFAVSDDVVQRQQLCGAEDQADAGRIEAPGRLRFGDGPLWVLWIDEGYRTAVIGRPDGTIGGILDRTGEISPDRWIAAREILDFNGYDLARLPENHL